MLPKELTTYVFNNPQNHTIPYGPWEWPSALVWLWTLPWLGQSRLAWAPQALPSLINLCVCWLVGLVSLHK